MSPHVGRSPGPRRTITGDVRRSASSRAVAAVAGWRGARASDGRPPTLVGAYIALTKPRIIELLLITTLPAMVLAEQGWPSLALIVATIGGGALAAGGANAINMVVDRDIDRLMPRTPGSAARHRGDDARDRR